MMKTLRMQLEDAQMKEEAVHKQHRRLQNDYDELQVQNDELIQEKMEVIVMLALGEGRGKILFEIFKFFPHDYKDLVHY